MTTCDKFTAEIERVIQYFRDEFDLTYAEAIGAMELVKFDLLREASGDDTTEDFPTT